MGQIGATPFPISCWNIEAVKIINLVKEGVETLTKEDIKSLSDIFQIFLIDILGIKSEKENTNTNTSENLIKILINIRENCKKNKDFITADKIRDELEKEGIEIKDGRDGTEWEVK